MNINHLISEIATQAVAASRQLAKMTTEEKNQCLSYMADAMERSRKVILEANASDCEAARTKEISPALLDRLTLTPERFDAMVKGFREVVQLPDPVGTVLDDKTKANALRIQKCRVPIGVIAVIYESRPNVTADVSSLCLKSGNAIILRGGSDAQRTNQSIVDALLVGGKQSGLPEFALQFISTPDREAVKLLAQQEGKVDLIIPRGGAELLKTVVDNARVPIIKHDRGLCHIYIDKTADIEMAVSISENAKCQRPGVCNAVETLLVHESIATTFLPALHKKLGDHVLLRGDDAARKILPSIEEASEADWDTEYLDLILSIKIVDSIDQAIAHINRHGSHHSDSIVTNDPQAKKAFIQEIDSAAVYVNASTRFTDGGEFGMGAEIGISTGKLHARGPMGLEELTTYKYCVLGEGQIR